MSVHKNGQVAIVQTNGNPDCHVILRGGKAPQLRRGQRGRRLRRPEQSQAAAHADGGLLPGPCSPSAHRRPRCGRRRWPQELLMTPAIHPATAPDCEIMQFAGESACATTGNSFGCKGGQALSPANSVPGRIISQLLRERLPVWHLSSRKDNIGRSHRNRQARGLDLARRGEQGPPHRAHEKGGPSAWRH